MTKTVNILIALLLVGCERAPEPTEKGGILVSDGGGSATAYSITMADGTHCVALIGYSKAGITCDWDHAPGVER